MFSGKFSLLIFLYFVQGLPYGLQSVYLPLYFREESVPLTQISIFKLLLIPWLLKVFWAPLVDSYGTRRQWLMISVAGLAVVAIGTSLLVNPKQLMPLGIALFLLNLSTSMLDVALDSVTVSILAPEDLAKGNVAQVVSYKVGTVAGGGFIALFIHYFSWTAAISCLAIFYIYALLFVIVSPVLRKLGRKDYRRRRRVQFNSILNLVFIPNIPGERKYRRKPRWQQEDSDSESPYSSETESSRSAGSISSSTDSSKYSLVRNFILGKLFHLVQ